MLGSRNPPHSDARVGCAGHLVMMAARKWCGDWYVGGGCRGLRVVRTRCCQIVYFPGESAQRRKREMHPANAIVGTGRVGRGRGKGGGSLVGAGDSVVPWGGDTTCHDGYCTMVWCNLLYFWSLWVNFYTLGPPNSQLLQHSGTRK